jgi:hypothetical protein
LLGLVRRRGHRLIPRRAASGTQRGKPLTAAGLVVTGLTATSEGRQRSSLAALIVAETSAYSLI